MANFRLLFISVVLAFSSVPLASCQMPQKPLTDWTIISDSPWVKISGENKLFKRSRGDGFFVHIRITNRAGKSLYFDDKFAPFSMNQWCTSQTPMRGVIDERRAVVKPLSSEEKNKFLQLLEKRRTNAEATDQSSIYSLESGSSYDYYVSFSNGGIPSVEQQSRGAKFVIIVLDGRLLISDGQQVKVIARLDYGDKNADGQSAFNPEIPVSIPIKWNKIPEPAHVFDYSATGAYENAVQQFTEKIAKDSKDAQSYLSRADFYAKLGEYQKAIDDCNRVISFLSNKNSKFAEAYSARSKYREKLGQLDVAKQDGIVAKESAQLSSIYEYHRNRADSFSESLSSGKHAQDAADYANRAHEYFMMGENKKALDDINKAIALIPGMVNYPVLRAQIYNAEGEYDKAISDCNKVLISMPEAYSQRGYAYLKLGKLQQALADCNQSLLEAKKSGLTTDYQVDMLGKRGQVYIALEKYQDAISDFDKALSFKPQQFIYKQEWEPLIGEIHYLRAQAYQKLGKTAQSKIELSKARQLGFVSDKR